MTKLEKVARLVSKITGAPLPLVVGDLISLRGVIVGAVLAVAILLILDLVGVIE